MRLNAFVAGLVVIVLALQTADAQTEFGIPGLQKNFWRDSSGVLVPVAGRSVSIGTLDIPGTLTVDSVNVLNGALIGEMYIRSNRVINTGASATDDLTLLSALVENNGANLELYPLTHGTSPGRFVVDARKHMLRSIDGATTYFFVDSTGFASLGGITNPTRQFEVLGATGIGAHRYTNDANSTALSFLKSRSTVYGTSTILQNNDAVGMYRYFAADGIDMGTEIARLEVRVDDASPAANTIGGRWNFFVQNGVDPDNLTQVLSIRADTSVTAEGLFTARYLKVNSVGSRIDSIVVVADTLKAYVNGIAYNSPKAL